MASSRHATVETSPPPTIPLITSNSGGIIGNGSSLATFFLGTTKFIVMSDASNLVGGDTNLVNDIFIKDLTTGAITRVSTASNGAQANGESFIADWSNNNNLLMFTSTATNLFAGGSGNGGGDKEALFIKNLTTGVVTQIDVTATGVHGDGSVASGMFMHNENLVLLDSDATNLVAGDTNGRDDVFIKDLTTGVVTRVSTTSAGAQALGDSYFNGATLNDDQVFFTSTAANLAAVDTNLGDDIFVKNLTTGAVTCVSTSSAGIVGNGWSSLERFDDNGTSAIFTSTSSNLVAADTNNGSDIFKKDLTTGVLTALSTNSAGQLANAACDLVSISADGTKMLFSSAATNLVAGDTNGAVDLFLKDLTTGAVTRVFTSATFRAGDSVSFSGEFAANNKVVINYTYSNFNDYMASQATGFGATSFNYVYVVNLANNALSLVADGYSATYRGAGQQIGSQSDYYFGIGLAANGTDFVLLHAQYDILGANFSALGNAYLVNTSTQAVSRPVGDAGANTIQGDAAMNFLFGMAGIDQLVGLAGNDVLDGGTGGDLLKGGADNDTYFVDDVADRVVESNNQGNDTVYSAVTYAIGGQWVENVILTGTANINAAGNGADNQLTGNAGNNSLNGGAGADIMSGALGNDIYYIDNIGDVVKEAANAGRDTVLSSITYTLTANVEALGLSGFQAINGTGNALDNTLTGNGNVNQLSGGAGKDLLKGLGGNDILTGGADADLFSMSAAGVANGLDHIVDFTSGLDHIAFFGADYGFAAGTHLTAAQLHTGAAVGAFAQFLYNTVNHTLYFDADGAGGAAATAIVAFDNAAVPVSADIIFQ